MPQSRNLNPSSNGISAWRVTDDAMLGSKNFSSCSDKKAINNSVVTHCGVVEVTYGSLIRIDPAGPYISVGPAAPTGYLSHDGVWVGDDGGTYKINMSSGDNPREIIIVGTGKDFSSKG